ncbi:hypothetical protein [Myceligenerans cantabricum]
MVTPLGRRYVGGVLGGARGPADTAEFVVRDEELVELMSEVTAGRRRGCCATPAAP